MKSKEPRDMDIILHHHGGLSIRAGGQHYWLNSGLSNHNDVVMYDNSKVICNLCDIDEKLKEKLKGWKTNEM